MGELERRGAGEVPSGAGRGTPDLRQTTPIGVSLPTSDADLRRALDNIQEGCQVLDRNGRYLYVNEAAARQGGRTREEMLGHTMPEAFPGIEPSEMLGAVTRCLESRTSSRLETEYPVPHGTTGWLDVCIEAIPEGAFVLSVDISARKRVEQGLRTAAHFDLLTGLPNRSHLQTCFERLVGADRKCNGKLALLVVGVRRVQEVNFALGRRRGDALLRSVASRIRGALVESAEIARLDGDHFGVLLPDAGGGGVAARAAGAILEAMDRSQCVDGLTVDVAARVGIALCPEHGTDFQTLLRNAEVALHAARQADSGHAVYDPAADRFTPRRLALMADLLPAIERQQFVLHYQPIVGLEAGSVLGFEALIRWKHPEHGMISPDEFISLAEHTGAIRPLTLWVLETALSTCRELRQAGWPLTMAVNISARSLGDAGFVEQLERILEKIGARPGWLDLELTESMVMSDSDRAREMLDRLGKLGLHISIDDFGTGYSSLGYLRKLPVHTLKIDRSFLGAGGPTPGRRDSAIIRAIVDVGRALGLTVVAEGVETEEALEALRQLGCDRAQGYHIARPMPAADVARWLTDSPWGLRSIGVSN